LDELWLKQQAKAAQFLKSFDFQNKKNFAATLWSDELGTDSVTGKKLCDVLGELHVNVANGVSLAPTEEHAFFFAFIKLLSVGGSTVKSRQNRVILQNIVSEMVAVDDGNTLKCGLEQCELSVDTINGLVFKPPTLREKQSLKKIIHEIYDEAKRVMDDFNFKEILEMQIRKSKAPDEGADDDMVDDKGKKMVKEQDNEEMVEVPEEVKEEEEDDGKDPEDGQQEIGMNLMENEEAKKAEDKEREQFDGKKENVKGTASWKMEEGFEGNDDGNKNKEEDILNMEVKEEHEVDEDDEGRDDEDDPSMAENEEIQHQAQELRDDLDGRRDEEKEEDTEKKKEPLEGLSAENKPMDSRDEADFVDDGSKDAVEAGKSVMDQMEEGVNDGDAEIKGMNAVENGGKQSDIFDGVHFKECNKKLRDRKKRAATKLSDLAGDEDEDDDDPEEVIESEDSQYLVKKQLYTEIV